MRGSAPFIIQIFIMIMILIVFILDKNIYYSKHVEIVAGAVKLYEVENSVESLKRSLDSAVAFLSPIAAYEYGVSEKVLDGKFPTTVYAQIQFEKNLKAKLSGFKPVEIEKNDIVWSEPDIKTFAFGDKIKVFGSRPISVKNRESPNAIIHASGNFEHFMKNNLYNMVAASRKLFDETPWKISKSVTDAESDECKNKFSEDETVTTKNLLLNSILCGYGDQAGIRYLQYYDKTKVTERIDAVLHDLAGDLKRSSGFDFLFTYDIQEGNVKGVNKEITIQLSGAATDTNVKIPTKTGKFEPMKFAFKSTITFDMMLPPS